MDAPPSAAFAVASVTRNRSYMLSVPRPMLALRAGAMHYGAFIWEKG
jgi:tocopherol O-methyltransferase